MSIWCSIPGTNALHYENSVTDPRKAKKTKGYFAGDSGDEVDLAVVMNYVFDENDTSDGYLPYLRLSLLVHNDVGGDVILNRKQVKKLHNELTRFLKDTKKKKENPKDPKENPKVTMDEIIRLKPLSNETMQEYSVRTGVPISVMDWSYWETKERQDKEKKE
jgi:hypothetical protein